MVYHSEEPYDVPSEKDVVGYCGVVKTLKSKKGNVMTISIKLRVIDKLLSL